MTQFFTDSFFQADYYFNLGFLDIGNEVQKFILHYVFLPRINHAIKSFNYGENIDLKLEKRIGNIEWYKCGCECYLIATFAESFCLLLGLKSQSARGAYRYSAFIGNCPTISLTCY